MRARWASAGVWLIPILFAISPMFWAGLPPTADGRRLPHALGALAMGLALAAFFWIPALAERPRVQWGRLLEGYSDFRRHFLPPGRLIAPIPLMDQAAGNKPEVLMVGLHQALLGFPSLCIAIRHPPLRWYEWPPMRHLRVDGGTAWPLPLALEAHP